MKTEGQKLVDDYLLFAEDECRIGNITEKVLYKIRLQMAAEYLLYHDNEELSLITLNKVPEEYILIDLPTDMKNDSLLALTLLEYIHHLEVRGITFVCPIRVTQTAAEA